MGHNFKAAEAYCIRLAPDCNVFAVNATNDLTVRNPAGLLATIQIKYTDGFTDTIVTDANWHSFTSVPNGFQNNDFDDSAWPPATIEGNYGVAPWNAVTIPSSASSTPLTLSDANWIWTNEVSGGNAPVGTRAFRKDITLPTGQRATSATFLVDADNGYTLYLQGNIVGSGDDYTSANPSASQISIVAFTANTGGPAGFIAAVELEMEDCDCGSVTSFVTDGTWKYSISPPSGFQNATFDASGWPNAVVEGKYGIAPWGNVPVPDTISTSVAPIPGAPAAMSAKVVQ
ncbi:hypothetical protein CPB84DRAFT_1783804 [Gymnopilus junonius]|uniref:Lectin n=1 Tax=Gymnopilus junonius TaxID=109634 RepID=A0A9P5NKC8_GYMJU|nr:hypothetical protein CPB84DRAFT_1783804 [Gymnopilus junonius]